MKHRLRLCFSSPLLFVLAGACAAPSQSANRASSPDEKREFAVVTKAHNVVSPQEGDELICEFEETVGSHIPRRICRSKTQIEAARQETQKTMQELRPAPPAAGN